MQSRYLSRENFHIAKTVNDGGFNTEARNSRDNSLNDDHTTDFVRTQTQLLKKRKEELLQYNMQTFANITHELPKFSQEEADKKWWTKRSGYNPKTDMTISAKELTLKKLMCGSGARPEAMVIADHTNEVPPPDPFKSVHVPKPPKSTGKEPCTEKPNQVKSQ
jgi:hypothetical protein